MHRRPGKPNRWSPCKCEMKTLVMRPGEVQRCIVSVHMFSVINASEASNFRDLEP